MSDALAPLPRPCTQAGCHRLVTGREGRCEFHPRPRRDKREYYRRKDKERGTAAERGYDHRWRALRNAHIRANPLCLHCLEEGRTTAAQEVDHILPIRTHPERRLDPSNLQSLCRRHHRAKTQRETRNP